MSINQIPQIQACEALNEELKEKLSEELFNKYIDTLSDLINRFETQLDITEYLATQLSNRNYKS